MPAVDVSEEKRLPLLVVLLDVTVQLATLTGDRDMSLKLAKMKERIMRQSFPNKNDEDIWQELGDLRPRLEDLLKIG